MPSLFPKDGKFYKANLHCHTVISDGRLTPEEVKAAYVAQGYSAVAFTDHEVFLTHNDLTDDGFVALNGYETAIKQRPGEHTGNFYLAYHLNLIACSQDLTLQPFADLRMLTPGNCKKHFRAENCREILQYEFSPDGVNSLVRRAREAGFFVTYNHPAWSMIPLADYLQLEGLCGIEVMNTGAFANGDCSGLPLGDFARRGKRVLPIGGDDNHNDHGYNDSFGAYTMLCARGGLSYASLIEALENGWSYVSGGPQICDIGYEGNRLYIRTSPATRIILLSEGRYTRTVEGDGITEAYFDRVPEKTGSFVRFEVVDAQGARAISRGYFADEFKEI